MTATGALQRLVAGSAKMTPEVARAVMAWRFAESDQERLSELLERNRAATITSDELRELDWYLLLGDFLTILHAQATQVLQRSTAA